MSEKPPKKPVPTEKNSQEVEARVAELATLKGTDAMTAAAVRKSNIPENIRRKRERQAKALEESNASKEARSLTFKLRGESPSNSLKFGVKAPKSERIKRDPHLGLDTQAEKGRAKLQPGSREKRALHHALRPKVHWDSQKMSGESALYAKTRQAFNHAEDALVKETFETHDPTGESSLNLQKLASDLEGLRSETDKNKFKEVNSEIAKMRAQIDRRKNLARKTRESETVEQIKTAMEEQLETEQREKAAAAHTAVFNAKWDSPTNRVKFEPKKHREGEPTPKADFSDMKAETAADFAQIQKEASAGFDTVDKMVSEFPTGLPKPEPLSEETERRSDLGQLIPRKTNSGNGSKRRKGAIFGSYDPNMTLPQESKVEESKETISLADLAEPELEDSRIFLGDGGGGERTLLDATAGENRKNFRAAVHAFKNLRLPEFGTNPPYEKPERAPIETTLPPIEADKETPEVPKAESGAPPMPPSVPPPPESPPPTGPSGEEPKKETPKGGGSGDGAGSNDEVVEGFKKDDPFDPWDPEMFAASEARRAAESKKAAPASSAKTAGYIRPYPGLEARPLMSGLDNLRRLHRMDVSQTQSAEPAKEKAEQKPKEILTANEVQKVKNTTPQEEPPGLITLTNKTQLDPGMFLTNEGDDRNQESNLYPGGLYRSASWTGRGDFTTPTDNPLPNRTTSELKPPKWALERAAREKAAGGAPKSQQNAPPAPKSNGIFSWFRNPFRSKKARQAALAGTLAASIGGQSVGSAELPQARREPQEVRFNVTPKTENRNEFPSEFVNRDHEAIVQAFFADHPDEEYPGDIPAAWAIHDSFVQSDASEPEKISRASSTAAPVRKAATVLRVPVPIEKPKAVLVRPLSANLDAHNVGEVRETRTLNAAELERVRGVGAERTARIAQGEAYEATIKQSKAQEILEAPIPSYGSSPKAFTNKNKLSIDPMQPRLFVDKKGIVSVYGGGFDARSKLAYEYKLKYPKETVRIKVESSRGAWVGEYEPSEVGSNIIPVAEKEYQPGIFAAAKRLFKKKPEIDPQTFVKEAPL